MITKQKLYSFGDKFREYGNWGNIFKFGSMSFVQVIPEIKSGLAIDWLMWVFCQFFMHLFQFFAVNISSCDIPCRRKLQLIINFCWFLKKYFGTLSFIKSLCRSFLSCYTWSTYCLSFNREINLFFFFSEHEHHAHLEVAILWIFFKIQSKNL